MIYAGGVRQSFCIICIPEAKISIDKVFLLASARTILAIPEDRMQVRQGAILIDC